MSWLFSQALVEDCLRANYLDGERFAPLKLMPIAPMFLSQDKTKKSWNPSRFGTMFQPLTESLGVELLMWFLAGFRAKTYQPPEPSTDLQKELRVGGGADFGDKWQELLAKFDPISSSWKTAQCLLAEDYQGSWATFPKWGMMQNGELWRLQNMAHPTKENGCGFLPTPVASEWRDKAKANILKKLDRGGRLARRICTIWNLSQPIKVAANPRFSEWMMGWPIGWTELKPLGMDKFQSWLKTQSRSY